MCLVSFPVAVIKYPDKNSHGGGVGEGCGSGGDEVRQVKALATGLDDLSPVPLTHMAGGRTNMLSEPHIRTPLHVHAPMLIQRPSNNQF